MRFVNVWYSNRALSTLFYGPNALIDWLKSIPKSLSLVNDKINQMTCRVFAAVKTKKNSDGKIEKSLGMHSTAKLTKKFIFPEQFSKHWLKTQVGNAI